MTDIEWTNTTIKLGQLKPWADNPKTSTGKQQAQLTNSFDELGQFQTVAISPTGDVFDGHQRLSALLAKHGGDYEVMALQSSRALTEEERRKIAIYSRQIGAWDWDKLANWDAPLIEWGLDTDLLQDWGRDYAALSDMLASEEEELAEGDAEPQTNRAEELREEWGVELGQMWRLPSRVEGQEHRLICGDCTDAAVVERVMGGEKAELLVNDPPYGMKLNVDYKRGKDTPYNGASNANTKDYSPVIGDDVDYDPHEIMDIFKSTKEQYWFGADYYAKRIPENGSWLVWDKRHGIETMEFDGSSFELCWSKTKHNRDIIRVRWSGILGMETQDTKTRMHPTQKPVEVLEWIINKRTKSGSIIADVYLGSGTTIIAAENLSRQCRAVEISPAYVAVALQRYADAFGITPELITE